MFHQTLIHWQMALKTDLLFVDPFQWLDLKEAQLEKTLMEQRQMTL
jgi:hypothetical protein